MRVGLDITQVVKRRGRGIARYIREILPRLADPALDMQATCCIRSERWWRRSLVNDLVPEMRRSWLPFSFWLSTGGLELFQHTGRLHRDILTLRPEIVPNPGQKRQTLAHISGNC